MLHNHPSPQETLYHRIKWPQSHRPVRSVDDAVKMGLQYILWHPLSRHLEDPVCGLQLGVQHHHPRRPPLETHPAHCASPDLSVDSDFTSRFKVHLLVILQHRVAQWNASCSPFIRHTQKKKFTDYREYIYGMRRMGWGVLQPEERSCFIVWWYDSRYFCITCQMAAGWTASGWGGYCLLISFGLCAGTSPHLTLMLSRWVPVMFWMVLTTCWRALLFWVMHKPC